MDVDVDVPIAYTAERTLKPYYYIYVATMRWRKPDVRDNDMCARKRQSHSHSHIK